VRSGSALAAPAVCSLTSSGFSTCLRERPTFKDGVDPIQLGVSYYLAVIKCTGMLVVHIVIFVYLLRRRLNGMEQLGQPLATSRRRP